MKKRKLKKAFIIIFSLIVLIVALFFLFLHLGNKNLKIEISKEIASEVEYKEENFKYPIVKCSFFGRDITKDNLELIKDIDLEKLGDQELKYKCSKLFFTKEESIKVKVVDKTPPEIKLTGDVSMSLYVGDKYEEKGAVATDNVDGDITDKIVVEGTVDTSKEGTYELVYSITDSQGLISTAKRSVVVKAKPVPAKTTTTTTTKSSASLGCGQAGVIYLTFDDGPNSSYTPVILDVLKKYNVKATFFVLGSKVNSNKSLIKREIDEGHAVGIHTWSHEYSIVYKSSENFWSEVSKTSSAISSLTGYETKLLRFPGGVSNTVSRKYKKGIMTQLAKETSDKGYSYFDWNVSSGDAGGTTDPNVEYKNVVNSLSKKRGNVVLMHDIKKHTSLAIEKIVKYGIDNGYEFKVLTSDVICHQRINN